MAKAKVTHSADGCTITMEGNKSSPEPSTSVIKFPFGYAEVSRTSDGNYWVHVQVNQKQEDEFSYPGDIYDSRIDYTADAYFKYEGDIPPIPADEEIQHIAIKVGKVR